MREHECVVDKLGGQIPLFGCRSLLDRVPVGALGAKQSPDLLVNVIISASKAFPGWVHRRYGRGWRRWGAGLLTFVVHDLVVRPETLKSGGKELVKRTGK